MDKTNMCNMIKTMEISNKNMSCLNEKYQKRINLIKKFNHME